MSDNNLSNSFFEPSGNMAFLPEKVKNIHKQATGIVQDLLACAAQYTHKNPNYTYVNFFTAINQYSKLTVDVKNGNTTLPQYLKDAVDKYNQAVEQAISEVDAAIQQEIAQKRQYEDEQKKRY